MEPLLLIKALILGCVEGLTEFLPISSTGHLIIVANLLGFNNERDQVFEIVIQTGAILAVCWEYRAKLIATFGGLLHDRIAQRFAINIVIAFLPFAVTALLFYKSLKAVLFKPIPVALAFLVGGLIILWAERWYARRSSGGTTLIDSVDELTWKHALKLGLAQCAALIPGTSRSGATIIGGLFFGLSRRCAAEFSFFLAIPTLIGAAVYSLWKARGQLSAADVPIFGVGLIAAFFSAFIVVRWLIRFVSSHDFRPFAWYRIAFGIVVLVTASLGIVSWQA